MEMVSKLLSKSTPSKPEISRKKTDPKAHRRHRENHDGEKGKRDLKEESRHGSLSKEKKTRSHKRSSHHDHHSSRKRKHVSGKHSSSRHHNVEPESQECALKY